MESEKVLERLTALAEEERCTFITPPTLKGKSGFMHSFSFLASFGDKAYGVDTSESIGQIDWLEVMKVRIKQYDTGVFCCMMSLTGKPEMKVKKLGADFGIKIFGTDELEELIGTLREAMVSAAGRVVS